SRRGRWLLARIAPRTPVKDGPRNRLFSWPAGPSTILSRFSERCQSGRSGVVEKTEASAVPTTVPDYPEKAPASAACGLLVHGPVLSVEEPRSRCLSLLGPRRRDQPGNSSASGTYASARKNQPRSVSRWSRAFGGDDGGRGGADRRRHRPSHLPDTGRG